MWSQLCGLHSMMRTQQSIFFLSHKKDIFLYCLLCRASYIFLPSFAGAVCRVFKNKFLYKPITHQNTLQIQFVNIYYPEQQKQCRVEKSEQGEQSFRIVKPDHDACTNRKRRDTILTHINREKKKRRIKDTRSNKTQQPIQPNRWVTYT